MRIRWILSTGVCRHHDATMFVQFMFLFVFLKYLIICGSTIRTLLHEKINPKDRLVLSISLGDVPGFSHFLREISQVILANLDL